MSELELVRTLYPEPSGASDAARARARAACHTLRGASSHPA